MLLTHVLKIDLKIFFLVAVYGPLQNYDYVPTTHTMDGIFSICCTQFYVCLDLAIFDGPGDGICVCLVTMAFGRCIACELFDERFI